MVELEDVTKRFGSTTAVDRLSLRADPGRTTVLIGPSGCGKSTVLRLVMGLICPDEGRIAIDGREVEPANVHTMRRRIGYVIQEGGLFPHMTARKNVTLMARQLGWSETERAERVRDLADLTGLSEDRLEAFPRQLSGGQRQRVSLMRALMLDPNLLLLDEPLGALDPLIRSDLQSDLRAIFERLDKTVLLVTHDMHEAAYFGHAIALLREGRLVQVGPPKDLLERPSSPFVERFIRAQRIDIGL